MRAPPILVAKADFFPSKENPVPSSPRSPAPPTDPLRQGPVRGRGPPGPAPGRPRGVGAGGRPNGVHVACAAGREGHRRHDEGHSGGADGEVVDRTNALAQPFGTFRLTNPCSRARTHTRTFVGGVTENARIVHAKAKAKAKACVQRIRSFEVVSSRPHPRLVGAFVHLRKLCARST